MTDEHRSAAPGYGPFNTEPEPPTRPIGHPVHPGRPDEGQPHTEDQPHADNQPHIEDQPDAEGRLQSEEQPASLPAHPGRPYGPTGFPSYGPPQNQAPTSTAGPTWPTGPTSGIPHQTSGVPHQTSGIPHQSSGIPYQTSGVPSQVSGIPGPTSGVPGNLDPYGLEPDPWESRFQTPVRPGPRIEPSPPSNRRGPLIGGLIGLLCGLLVFGTGGYLVGRVTADPAPGTQPTAAPTSGPLPIYEQSQVALNQSKFPASMAGIAQGWLPYLNGCNSSTRTGGPSTGDGEKVKVRCSLDGMSVLFVEYDSVSARDKARATAALQNVDARSLTPGVGDPHDQAAPSGRTTGNYVEYAYRVTENKAEKTVAGIRWDDAQAPVAGFLLAFWVDGAGSSWAPMRDLWGRYA